MTDDDTDPGPTPIHYPFADLIPAQHPIGPRAPEPVSHVPMEPTADYYEVTERVRHLNRVSRHPKADPSWPSLRDSLWAWKHYLDFIVLNAKDDSWITARFRLSVVQAMLEEKP